MDQESYIADRVSSFIMGLSILIMPIMLFIDWRFSVIAILLIWNQFAFRSSLKGGNGGMQMMYSLGAIIIFIWKFFIES